MLIDHGKPVVDRLHREGIDVSSEAAQLPISGMARSPALAIRYNMPEANKVRRIQMKFSSARDFDVAFDHVRELGLWFTPTQKARPVTPAPHVQRSGPSCPPSQLSEITGRPGTAVPSTSTGLHTQLQDTARLRPSTASFFNPGSTASSRRPDSAASLSHESASVIPLSARLDTTNAFLASDIPPRRELPFERLDTPESPASNSTRSESRPLSGIMGPPTLPASALSGSKRPKSRSGSSNELELPPLRRPTYLSKTSTGQTARPNATPGPSSDTIRPQSAITPNNYSAMQQMMSSAPVLTPSIARPASSYNTATTHPLSIVTNSHNQTDRSVDLVTPPGSDVNMLSPDPEDHGDIERHAEELGAYTKQSNDARMNELNNFIFRHLEDDNFLTLVTDMQMAWARIGTRLE
ncbi:hypothetical protein BU23DRAFT_295650 [Bimuria novae-zelandiae CBS 107.79]|uniref:Uncharacterized protein n=1 Tax=Bimuria novae-zelandiae CBS 107.79 TaxID=1447943 RepID=A0A6A5VLQ3_9PLEO|nr:hypothetical protein BU23DRAFT_295650 [Bimuria novae-zelandiae CBS 107.79]